MKKLAAFLAIIVLLGLIVQACGTYEKCEAYGEHKRYRVESR